MSAEWLASLRMTNGIWLSSVLSSRTRWAMKTPDTVLVGTVHEADTAQLPQSVSPVVASFRQAGCDCGSDTDGWMVAIRRAPLPW